MTRYLAACWLLNVVVAAAGACVIGRDIGRAEVRREDHELIAEQLRRVEDIDPQLEQLWVHANAELAWRVAQDDQLRHLGRAR